VSALRGHVARALQAALLGVVLLPTAFAARPQCAPPAPGEPIFITGQCVDPRFNGAECTAPERRTDPVDHYFVACEFPETDARFTMTFPPEDKYEGRFFMNTHPLYTDPPNVPANDIAFGVASGAYFVRTNMGGSEQARAPEDTLEPGFDAASGGYRINAAAAKHAVQVARELYGDHDPYGYLYGGSGGAYQTICSAEHTAGVWDGYVPFVMGTPHAIPSMFTVRIHALRVLRQRNKFPEIMDAIDPGGSGDPYATLNAEEAEALDEATRMGFPPRGWWNHPTLTGGPLRLVAGYVPLMDPHYTEDFFTTPGYLGFEDPFGSVAAARVQHATSVRGAFSDPRIPFPGILITESLPEGNKDLSGADLLIESGAGAGKQIPLFGSLELPVVGTVLALQFGVDPAVLSELTPGVRVRIDNSGYLALQTYHRHQVPESDGFHGWDQFLDKYGRPLYPQRDVLIGPIGAFNGAGCLPSGNFAAPMALVQNLMDIDAMPWQADWYRTKVFEAQGKQGADQRFRLWYTDHAQHTSPSAGSTAALARTINYAGVLQHAVRDVSAWVEQGVIPPASTSYDVADSQVLVPDSAGRRKGIQPVVRLKANGSDRAEVAVGQEVRFSAWVQAPPDAGKIVGVEWDFEGVGDFPVSSELTHIRGTQSIGMTYSYDTPGTYFPVVRGTSQREGNPDDAFARAQNLGRARVIVR
jgi:hypothetical protein